MNKKIMISGVLFILTAIILGAFGAHSLKTHISSEKITSFEVGVRYQMYSGLALLFLGLAADKLKFSLQSLHFLLLLGTILFSGSIYLLALQEMFDISLRFLGPATPIGGAILILGWIIFLVKLLQTKE